MKAARAAIDKAGGDVVFTARSEGFIRGRPDLDETIRRLKAFADAGADCLYSPGIKTREQIEATVKAVAPKPINFLNSGAFGFTVKQLGEMGVRRISVGGTLARVAMHAFVKAASEIANEGTFDSFAGVISNAGTQQIFQRRPRETHIHMTNSEPHPQTGRPVGLPVETAPAQRPGPVTLQGRFGRIEKLDASHAASLWRAVKDDTRLWTYLNYGPFSDAAAFAAWVGERVALGDPYSYAVLDGGRRRRRHRHADGNPPRPCA